MLGPNLAGTRLTLGPIAPEHLESYCRWFADPAVTRYLARDTPPSLREEQAWFDRVATSEADLVWAVFAEGQHIGSTGLHQIDWRHRRAVTGTVIGDRAWWGRGVATEAMALRTWYAFNELGLQKLVTNVVEANVASRRALERVGYRTVGRYRRHEFRHGEWLDVWIGELLRDEWAARQHQDAPAT